MNFADELRNQSTGRRGDAEVDADIAYWRDGLVYVIKHECRKAALAGRRNIYGYIHLNRDGDFDEAGFDEDLPRTNDLGNHINAVNWTESGWDATDPDDRTMKTRLYEGYIIPGDVARLQQLENAIHAELKELGFTEYRVQKVKLMDTYVVRRQKRSLLSGEITEQITTGAYPDPVFTLHFSLAW